MSFSMAEELRKQLGGVSDSDHGREQITYIDIGLLDKDEKNFYKLTKVEELASNIQVCGLQQPIRVRAGQKGHYTIVSGHRRRAAMQLLLKEGHEEFREVPCIIEQDEASEAMRELRLIFANSSTRELSSGDLAKQAERVEMLLYQLKKEGVEFPGRMRDQVAAACKVSSTRVAVWKVIRENLIDGYRAYYEKEKITESAAYAIARMPAEFQERVLKACKDKVTASYAEGVLKKVMSGDYDYSPCLTCPDGKSCTHAAAFIRHDMESSEWDRCGGKICCVNCEKSSRDWSPCGNMCARAKEARKTASDKKKAKEEKAAAKERTKLVKSNAAAARRILRAADAAGLADDVTIVGRYYSSFTIAELRALANGQELSKHFSCEDEITPTYADELKKAARQLRCTTDYILGLTEDLTPDPQPEGQLVIAGWMPGGTTPRTPCEVVAVFDLGNGNKMKGIYQWNGREFTFRKGGASINMIPIKWMMLPPDEDEGGQHDENAAENPQG